MDFVEVFNSTWNLLGDQVRKTSHETSSYPDLPTEFWVSGEYLRTAEDAIALLLILPLVVTGGRNYFQISSLRNHIGNMANNYRLEGKWEEVAELLTIPDPLSVYTAWRIILNKRSLEDWFGNVVPHISSALRAIRKRKVYHSVVSDTRPVRKPQRKRGYDDKGSRRLPHQSLNRVPVEEEFFERILVKEPQSVFWWGVQKSKCIT